jgi:hypothetical protein
MILMGRCQHGIDISIRNCDRRVPGCQIKSGRIGDHDSISSSGAL